MQNVAREPKRVRIFVVDDSAVARALLRTRLDGRDGIVVVGEARNGADALLRIPGSQADLVVMDLHMPGMDGLTVAQELMATAPRPIVVISDLSTRDSATGFRALQAGVLEMMQKPTAAELGDETSRKAFTRKLRMLAGVPVVTRHKRGTSERVPAVSRSSVPPPPATSRSNESPVSAVSRSNEPPPATSSRPSLLPTPAVRPELLCVGASTGGPPALLALLSAFTKPPSCPVLVVQHMAPGFIAGMARWLGDATKLPIRLAEDGNYLVSGTVYVAPDDRHLTLRGNRIVLVEGPQLAGHRPSVDALFESVADGAYGAVTLAVLLTGMGSDGARGLLRLRQAGSFTIAQDEATSVVYGMPKVAKNLEAACEILPIDRIAKRVRAACES